MAQKRARPRSRGPKSLPGELIDIFLNSPVGQSIDDKVRQLLHLPGRQPEISGKIKSEAQRAAEKIKRDRDAPYRVLGVDPGAEEAVIKAAYKAKAKLFHPDSGGQNSKMEEINAAYERILTERGWRK